MQRAYSSNSNLANQSSQISELNNALGNIHNVKVADVDIKIQAGDIHETYTVPTGRTIISVTMLYTYSLYMNQAIPFRDPNGTMIGVMFANGSPQSENIVYKVRYAYY